MLEEGNECRKGAFEGCDEITLGNCVTTSSVVRITSEKDTRTVFVRVDLVLV